MISDGELMKNFSSYLFVFELASATSKLFKTNMFLAMIS